MKMYFPKDDDPIIAEIRRIREEIWEECGHDPVRRAEMIRKAGDEFREQQRKERANRQLNEEPFD